MRNTDRKDNNLKKVFLSLINLLIKSFDDIGTIIRYGISGITSIFVNLLVIYLLTDILGLWYLASAVIAFITSFTIAFILLKYWTFKGARHSAIHIQAITYFLVVAGSLVLNLILLYIFVDILGFWYLGVQVLALIFVSGINFIVNKNLTFKE